MCQDVISKLDQWIIHCRFGCRHRPGQIEPKRSKISSLDLDDSSHLSLLQNDEGEILFPLFTTSPYPRNHDDAPLHRNRSLAPHISLWQRFQHLIVDGILSPANASKYEC